MPLIKYGKHGLTLALTVHISVYKNQFGFKSLCLGIY